MLKARLYDAFNFARKLSLGKICNMIRVVAGYHLSKLTHRSMHGGLPVSVSIEPTTACNLGCPECPSGLKMFSREAGNLRESDFASWIDQLSSHVVYLNFYFQGEPYIHPRFLDFVTRASRQRIYTSTSTNAHFLHDELARKTVESGLDRLIISIDGTTQEVYEQYRIHGRLDKVLDGTRNIVKWKNKLRSRTPYLIFQFLVVRPNEHQVDDVKRLAHELGVDAVRFKTAQVYNYENGNDLIPLNPEYSRYTKHDNGTYSLDNKLDNHCWRMWSGCVITWDGNIVPCCFDKDASHSLGNLRSHSLRDIWNNQAYRAFRSQLFRSRSEIDICANCSEGTRVWAEA